MHFPHSPVHAVAVVLANIINPVMLCLWLTAIWRRHERSQPVRNWIRASSIAALIVVTIAEALKRIHPWHQLGAFPSGHEAFATTFAMSTALIDRSLARNASLLALVLAPSLVFANFHRWSDVLASLAYGPTLTVGIHNLLGTYKQSWLAANFRQSPPPDSAA